MTQRLLITGANRGIGLEMTRQAAARGDRVTAACRQPDAAEALQELAAAHAGSIHIIAMDVGSAESVAAAAQDKGGFEDGLDLVVANAGQLNARGGLNDPGHTEANIAESLMTNVAGVFFTARYFVPFLRTGKPGRAASAPGKFAVISSQMGSSTRSGTSAPVYRASKAAATNLARSLALELAPDGIAVGAWHPGWVQTDMGGAEAAITPQASAEGLLARFDALTMDSSGIFETWDGEVMPF